jgi:hypothetical protein
MGGLLGPLLIFKPPKQLRQAVPEKKATKISIDMICYSGLRGSYSLKAYKR